MSNEQQTIEQQPSADASATVNYNNGVLAGDKVRDGIKVYKEEIQDDLWWFHRYAAEKKISDGAAAEMLGVDGSTFSRVYRGEYRNANRGVLPPPAKMLSRIRVVRGQERENALKRCAGRVKTLTVNEIWHVCRKTWNDRLIGFVFGESHVGKSEALKWFRDENNHGATIYVDLQGVTGVQDIYREFARALKLSAETSLQKLMPRVINAIDRTNLVIVDEFHHITYAYQKGSSIRMVNALKSIKDRTGCGMVICATDVGREQIESGKESKLLTQLWRRGVVKLQLPAALRVADVRPIVKAYGLDFPDAPTASLKRADTWKHLKEDHPNFVGLEVCDRIAYNFGIEHLFSVLKDGNVLANKANHELTWADVCEAQAIYDGLSNPKKEV